MNKINPMETFVYHEREQILNLRAEYNLGLVGDDGIENLINTVQWYQEMVERMEEHQNWFMSNLTKEQFDKFCIEVLGWTDKDFKEAEEAGKKIGDKFLKLIQENKREK